MAFSSYFFPCMFFPVEEQILNLVISVRMHETDILQLQMAGSRVEDKTIDLLPLWCLAVRF